MAKRASQQAALLKPNSTVLIAFFSVCVMLVAACGKTASSDPRSLTPMVSVEGSDTMTVLLTAWEKEFMKLHPDIPVSVTTADSGAGIQALLEQRTDVAASSRDLTPAENQSFHSKSMHLSREIVAMDSIAVIVNPTLSIDEISMDELKDVFTGKISEWSAIDPKLKVPIDVCVREPGSGTSKYFTEHVLKERGSAKDSPSSPYAKSAKIFNSHEALIETVASDKNAVGYVGLSYAVSSKSKVKLLKIKLLKTSPAVAPSKEAATNNYPLSRPLYIFFDSNAKPSTKQFAEFCMSSAGQDVVRQNGFVSMSH